MAGRVGAVGREELHASICRMELYGAIVPLDAGLYLVEATDGRYKAYTGLFVSKMALVTRTSNGTVLAYAVDRKTGAPLSKVQVRMGIKQQQVAEAETGDDGVADLHGPVSKA